MGMHVKVVASTIVHLEALEEAGYVTHADRMRDSEPAEVWCNADLAGGEFTPEFDAWQKEAYPAFIDELHEAAGRKCYLSEHRPNPATNTNKTYLGHIIEVDHLSVLGHGHVTLYVAGVSRALLLELERHQQRYSINFSVLSQRYVDHGEDSEIGFVIPPVLEKHLDEPLHETDTENGWTVRDELEAMNEQARDCYGWLSQFMERKGYRRKEIRGAARAVLPENTETRFFVTGSIRAWRNIIEQRLSDAADAEIREFAREVLREINRLAPNSVQDLAEMHKIGEE